VNQRSVKKTEVSLAPRFWQFAAFPAKSKSDWNDFCSARDLPTASGTQQYRVNLPASALSKLRSWDYVISAQAGIRCRDLDSRLRGNDGEAQFQALTKH